MPVTNGDITLRVEVAGDGPTVLCVSGWPELASSWHNQVGFLTSHGYRVAALDVRGYGGSSVPTEVERYTLKELAGDIAAVASALDDEPIVLVGHDWGAPIVWNAAIRHPDRVRAVAGLSVPYRPPTDMPLIDIFDQLYAGRFFYMLYFDRPSVPEADFGADLRGSLKRVFYALSGDAPLNHWLADALRDAALLPLLPEPPEGPLSFMSDTALDALAASFERTGMVGAFNRYRASRLDAKDSADIADAVVTQPSCFIAGERDPVRAFVPGVDGYADAGAACSDFRGSTIIAGAGHWVHQERPEATNTALLALLSSVE
ncbi:alpha/beta hydrolase [Mycolicibacterium sp. 120270]|uniref:alpha/beta fold hydrolase n=1 Tax=Mycolicibacterium sp. 120270 TaxID=3090600 RepID=UPI00299D4125|nr:alpha/beta hydrolase [Mycolicibacterium sp. 120270]MDX1885540.1 alpha/beta hydrolase [Mycolicibacterium sp. 120270]